MKYDLAVRPVHYACVSGGKDSLYMLNLILHNLDKYPLDCVVHYELEIDYPFVYKVIDYMESECKKHNIPFYRVKPTRTWKELYDKYDFPTRRARWCNNLYKLDSEKQVKKWIKNMNCRPVAYIGFCADETKRFKYQIGEWENQDVCYPLAEEGILESEILEWAKGVSIFDGWYNHFARQGCMMCPMATRKQLAYMYLKYNDSYNQYMNYARAYEQKYNSKYFGKYDCDYVDNVVKNKWVDKLTEEMEANNDI